MAGAKITITVDDADVRAMFARLAAFGEAPVKDAGRDIGEYMLRSTRERAVQERAPDGTPWVPLSPRYARRKERLRPGRPMLVFDNFMLGARLSYDPEPTYVDIGTSAVQGASMQFGRGGIPARPWLGASDEDLRELGEILGDHLRAAAEGRSGPAA
jgi:phage gpG-like protein